ncbi:MAG: DNA-directed RNA polymerase subunit omega [Acutalibacteraceae bacterium]|nr:DNA-directed RNA polymerase subunit omega [Acutalibacteraceae bacterium]
MLNPAIGKLINNTENRYKLVNQIAKKARTIADEAQEKEEIIIEKPVTIAINQMADEIK